MLAKAVSSLGFKVEGGEYGFNDVVMILQTIGLVRLSNQALFPLLLQY